MTGRDPGELGIYGFRNRADHCYDGAQLADSRAVDGRARLGPPRPGGQARRSSSACRRPPRRAVNGELVVVLPHAGPAERPVHPPARAPRTRSSASSAPTSVDVRNFRSDDRDRILAEIYAMTEQHFTVARHLLDTRPWDFFMMVEIGLDRMHHAFWRSLDPAHPRHEPGHRYARRDPRATTSTSTTRSASCSSASTTTRSSWSSPTTARGRWRARSASTSGSSRRATSSCASAGRRPTPFRELDVDWSAHARLGRGRLLLPAVPQRARAASRRASSRRRTTTRCATSSTERLEALPGPGRPPIGTRVLPARRTCGASGAASRPTSSSTSATSPGAATAASATGATDTFENDTGPDDANHARHGLCVMAGPGVAPGRLQDRPSSTSRRRSCGSPGSRPTRACAAAWPARSRAFSPRAEARSRAAAGSRAAG